jgi:membrane fusion protein (multidrug efflux system)
MANLAQAEATNVKAQRDVQRYRQLFAKNVIPREQYEEQLRIGKVDDAAVLSARATLGASAIAIDQRDATAAAAKATLDQAELNLSYTRIAAPVAGVVGEKSAEVGERVQPGQELLAIVPLTNIWITANFMETQLRKMAQGQLRRFTSIRRGATTRVMSKACRERAAKSLVCCRPRTPPATT